MAENHQYSMYSCARPTPLPEGEEDPWERLDKVCEYIEFRETAKECKDAHSLKPGHMFHSWKCRHDKSSFKLWGVKGSQPWQQFQTYKRDNWTWTCTNCATIQSGEDFPTERDVDGCPGAHK